VVGAVAAVLELEDDARRNLSGEYLGHCLVDVVEFAVDGDHRGPAGGVQGEHIGQVVAGTDDGPDDGWNGPMPGFLSVGFNN
jgi:hypothetical protein